MVDRLLRCWWEGVHVADITAKKPWDLRLRYTDEAQDRWPVNTPALSCSLPVQRRRINASNFLRGVLPEGAHLQGFAHLAGIPTNDVFGLLARYGRDIAGALVITAEDDLPDPDDWDVVPYSDDSLAAEIDGLPDHPLGVHADSELSIAGLQNKLLLVDLGDGRWGRPVRGHPSTHILKLDDDRHPGLIVLEADCLRLATAVGLSDASPITSTIRGARCLIVKRYDRVMLDGSIRRVHQEDACQALDVDPRGRDGRAKYESAGGPSLNQIAELLDVHARNHDHELDRLLRAVTFTGLTGNADAHGKNLSLLHDPDGFVALAPLYDTVPTMMWPKLRPAMAMTINGKWSVEQLRVDDLVAEAEAWGASGPESRRAIVEITDAVQSSVPATVTDEDLASRITGRCARLLATAG